MRDAETVLWIVRDRGARGLPLQDLYRQLFNPDLYLRAYGKIYRNRGAMTRGVTAETVDGMSLTKINQIIDLLRFERYRWTPARRILIPKKDASKKRPLGLPTWSDKLLQEVIRSLLEANYEPRFRPASHGFRPGRGCHTALSEIERTWKGTTWFIEGDIAKCFDSLNHDVLLDILGEQIHDGRFLHLVGDLLRAGYLEQWRYNATLSGTPQGGVVSPLLSNVYLDRLDVFVLDTLVPEYTRGEKRRRNPEYHNLTTRAAGFERRGCPERAGELRALARRIPSVLTDDPEYRRLRYVRYADDFLLGFTGPRAEAIDIKERIRQYLETHLHLELSESKTLITHARSEAARFLGYEITAIQDDDSRCRVRHSRKNGTIGLRVPGDVVRSKIADYQLHGKPVHRCELINDSVFTIISLFQMEFRGVAEYYKLAYNRSRALRRLKWVMEVALTKTIARKLRISVSKVYARYGVRLPASKGRPRKGLMVRVERPGKKPLTALWGGISLARQRHGVIDDPPRTRIVPRAELVQRLLAKSCELCGSTEDIEVHHVRALKDLRRRYRGRTPPPQWVIVMAARRRKTLVVCRACHVAIHAGRLR